MALNIQFMIIFLTMTLFSVVHCSLRNNNLIDFVEKTSNDKNQLVSNHLSQVYSSNIDTIEDGKFKGLIKPKADIITLERASAKSTLIKNINVFNFGAKGDGTHDDSEAFKKAWNAACSSRNEAVILVPKNKNYLVKPTSFSGPCNSKITFQISGTIQASVDKSDYKDRSWLLFEKVENLLVEGGGTINGNGKIWWQSSCKTNKKLPCNGAPTALTFYNGKKLIVRNLNIKDAQQIQVSFENCVNVEVSYLTVTAPDESPNTDGIHVTNTQNIRISNCVIGTGDDCISIVSGSKNVQATDITCGPGHGISIGSLGKNNAADYVSGVIVNRAKIRGTTNGVRIKTWQGGSGIATNITFQNIEMENVDNPIIIDQNYCDHEGPCKSQNKAVQVKNILYKNIKGSSATGVAIKFDCSKNFPCQEVKLQDVDLTLKGAETESKASCTNIKLSKLGKVSPMC